MWEKEAKCVDFFSGNLLFLASTNFFQDPISPQCSQNRPSLTDQRQLDQKSPHCLVTRDVTLDVNRLNTRDGYEQSNIRIIELEACSNIIRIKFSEISNNQIICST